jgi:putative lipoprotein
MPRALVAAGVVLVLVVLPGAGRARAQQAAPVDADPWFGHDKALHFAASASLAVVGYAGASLVTDDRPARIAVAASFALGLGIAKEVWDATGHGDASWRDLTWDVVGTTTGVLIACAIDWAIGRLRGPTKTSTTTSTTAPVKSPVTDP